MGFFSIHADGGKVVHKAVETNNSTGYSAYNNILPIF
jgi:hypothetical protein